MDRRREEEIEREARKLRLELVRRSLEFWDSPPDSMIDRIDPFRIAIGILGVDIEEPEEIHLPFADTLSGNLPFRIGGYIDRKRNKIGVARRFRMETRRFTLAHEIGHWQLHQGTVYFRDIPIVAGDRASSNRDPVEREANRFAEELLMPADLVKQYFSYIFGDVFPEQTLRNRAPDDRLAAWLSFGTERRVTVAELIQQGREYLALRLSECIPAGHPYLSLAQRFRVSPLAMSIRLQRLALV
jgi:IrrE N-terminal-like domain